MSVIVTLVRGGWIDPDTPEDMRTTTSLVDGTIYELMMSDEFNVPNRSFADGHDPMWTALDKSDDDSNEAGGGSLHFYNSSTVYTEDGRLKIKSFIEKTEWNHYDSIKKEYKTVTKHFKSGMLQSWNKFCFTGGIVEVDIILPGSSKVGGLWPAVWMLGNLGRATYESSTNMIWPWSYNECDRDLQEKQVISACNLQNHFGLNAYQGRGATEIDIIEMMTGDPGPLPQTYPSIGYPYADFTLQIAPGVPHNRPNNGFPPLRHITEEKNGHPTGAVAQQWYEGLEFYGNTSLNPYFYGTFLAPTLPDEPVQRNKNQAFQADAIGAMHQLTDQHFRTMHTLRLEWQPGPGGRLDWFTKAYRINSTSMDESYEGDGNGKEWVKIYTIKGESLEELMGSQIPIEPTSLVVNTAISSAWGFPYSLPNDCKECYDCDDPECACSFHQGFCQILREGAIFEMDHVRVYQTKNHSAHTGEPHTLGCDPEGYPTREFIKGNEERYSRPPPFNYGTESSLKEIQRGGGKCESNNDCGGDSGGRGVCIPKKLFTGHLEDRKMPASQKVCECRDGFTGPNCLALDHKDDTISAFELKQRSTLFHAVSKPYIPPFFIAILLFLLTMLVSVAIRQVMEKKRYRVLPDSFEGGTPMIENPRMKRPTFVTNTTGRDLIVTGRSV